ncbi:hypothetical protein GPJ56_003783 [Histomonas meleagridis]|uniref:uncharacterized protein n=1 Tax=Histomonas meleagridis TaxID=135588 RepID=UPI00355AA5CD|nr:hypothetical protein GPJ56_003783 [Histomonas meleagridis]KAH0805241.1 hypothetical protein GO595_002186 [Histomonas meleagridis]
MSDLYEFSKKHPDYETQFWSESRYKEEYNAFLREKQKERAQREREKEEAKRERKEELRRQRQEMAEKYKNSSSSNNASNRSWEDYIAELRRQHEEDLERQRRGNEYLSYIYQEKQKMLQQKALEEKKRQEMQKQQRNQCTTRPNNPPPPVREETWHPSDITNGPRIAISYQYNGQSLKRTFDIAEIITICEDPRSYKYWLEEGFVNSHQFVSIASQVREKILKNQPVYLTSRLADSKFSPLKNLTQFKQAELMARASKIIECNGTFCEWVPSAYDGTGTYIEVNLANTSLKSLKLYYPHMIAICEYPQDFKLWIQNANFDFNNENYNFVRRIKDITSKMRENKTILTMGKIAFFLECIHDINRFSIVQKAEQEIANLFNIPY